MQFGNAPSAVKILLASKGVFSYGFPENNIQEIRNEQRTQRP